MIKGVNKRIVEISDTNNRYFYKALLFVNAEMRDISNRKIEEEANKYLNSIIYKEKFRPGYLRKRKKLKKKVLFMLFILGIGVLSLLVLNIFH